MPLKNSRQQIVSRRLNNESKYKHEYSQFWKKKKEFWTLHAFAIYLPLEMVLSLKMLFILVQWPPLPHKNVFVFLNCQSKNKQETNFSLCASDAAKHTEAHKLTFINIY